MAAGIGRELEATEAEAEPLPGDAIASIAPEQIADARLIPIPALRLLSLDYDANEAFQAFRDERTMKPRRQKSWLAVHRRDYGVYRMPLSRLESGLLRGANFCSPHLYSTVR